jgi:hypothetical protein
MDSMLSAPRQMGSMLSLSNLVASLDVDISRFVFHNSGNDAYATLLALQLLLEPNTDLGSFKGKAHVNSAHSPPQSSPDSLSRGGLGPRYSATGNATKDTKLNNDSWAKEPFSLPPRRGSRGMPRGQTSYRRPVRGGRGRPFSPRDQPQRDRKLEEDLRDLTI